MRLWYCQQNKRRTTNVKSIRTLVDWYVGSNAWYFSPMTRRVESGWRSPLLSQMESNVSERGGRREQQHSYKICPLGGACEQNFHHISSWRSRHRARPGRRLKAETREKRQTKTTVDGMGRGKNWDGLESTITLSPKSKTKYAIMHANSIYRVV